MATPSPASPSPSSSPARYQPTLRIFVGCASIDLHAHRDAVRHEIDAFDEHPVVMGDFGARNGGATTVSLERVRSCDVYILLLAWRYGTIPTVPPDETLSITHQEYRAAKEANRPRLIFFADPTTEADDGPTALPRFRPRPAAYCPSVRLPRRGES